MHVFLTDGRVVGHSVTANPYTEERWLERPTEVPDDGCYLRLYGRSAGGEAVVAELKVAHLTLALVLPEPLPDDDGISIANFPHIRRKYRINRHV